ncbi:MAG: hypothetical protein HeimC2_18200 [Candidatus Heimdallarchaeota archaeon LC_2]|nr:MAG: hypothetical protein HeimC2_18200 [Candidatus Heimdallarchaeota archaeon LC_2]
MFSTLIAIRFFFDLDKYVFLSHVSVLDQIEIIGAGQKGSSHLLTLANLKNSSNIYVIDPSTDSLEVAKNMYLEVNSNNQDLNVTSNTDSSLLPNSLDLEIIATNSNSDSRVTIFEASSKLHISFMIS